ncbi:MAG TPA: hypothetical protein PKX00_07750, partial [Opitutaceae bacterium]|nr:hypothetical protein [Opitutaceae bacterium]
MTFTFAVSRGTTSKLTMVLPPAGTEEVERRAPTSSNFATLPPVNDAVAVCMVGGSAEHSFMPL